MSISYTLEPEIGDKKAGRLTGLLRGLTLTSVLAVGGECRKAVFTFQPIGGQEMQWKLSATPFFIALCLLCAVVIFLLSFVFSRVKKFPYAEDGKIITREFTVRYQRWVLPGVLLYALFHAAVMYTVPMWDSTSDFSFWLRNGLNLVVLFTALAYDRRVERYMQNGVLNKLELLNRRLYA